MELSVINFGQSSTSNGGLINIKDMSFLADESNLANSKPPTKPSDYVDDVQELPLDGDEVTDNLLTQESDRSKATLESYGTPLFGKGRSDKQLVK